MEFFATNGMVPKRNDEASAHEFLYDIILCCNILLYCVDLNFSFTFSVYIQIQLMFTLIRFIINVFYMFWPNCHFQV